MIAREKMSTHPVSVPMTSIGPIASTPAGASTLMQPPTASNGSATTTSQNSTFNVPTTTTINNASNSTSLTTGTNPQTKSRFPWRKIQRLCTFIAKIIFAVAGTIMAYLALNTAMWSSAKDYRDDCRSQNVRIATLSPKICANSLGLESYGRVSRACSDALHAILSSPLGLNLFISVPEVEQQALVRKDEAGTFSNADTEIFPVVKLLMTVAATCAIFYVLMFHASRYLRMRSLSARGRSQDLHAESHFTNTYSTWVGASVPRQAGLSNTSVPLPVPTTLRQRLLRNTNSVVNDDGEKESDWIVAGVSAVDRDLQQTSQPISWTSSDEIVHHGPTSPQHESSAEANEPLSLDDNSSTMDLDSSPSSALTRYSEDWDLGNPVLPPSWQSDFQAPEQQSLTSTATSMEATSNLGETQSSKTGVFWFSERLKAPESLHKYTHSERTFYEKGEGKDFFARSNSKNAELFSEMLDQYNQLQQQKMMENMEMQKTEAFWNPLKSRSTRDYTY